MKAHTESKEKQIILSIGMIVKNEEKVLERCLKSLQPLIKAIPSELIIADTGSTDSTVEIAQKYTNNVFHFDWINDFSAARNSTLEKAQGLWYFFLDADEYLDIDIHAIVEFFKRPELYEKFQCAQIMLRNYSDTEKKNYSTMALPRLHRISCENEDIIEFNGTIHETIPVRYPVIMLPTILHHTGYCYDSIEQAKNKMERNMKLLREEYHNNPDDLRILIHLIDSSCFELNERKKYIREALTISRKDRAKPYSNIGYLEAIKYYKTIDSDYSLELCDEYANTLDNAEELIGTLSMYFLKFANLTANSKFQDAYISFQKYIKLYDDYKKDKLKKYDLMFHPLEGVDEPDFIKANIDAAYCLKKLERNDDAFKQLDKLDVSKMRDDLFRNCVGLIRDICQETKEYTKLIEYYEIISDKCEKDKITGMIQTLEAVYRECSTAEERIDYAKAFLNCSLNDDFTAMMKLIAEQDSDTFNDKLAKFIESVDTWEAYLFEAIYLALKHNLDVSTAIDKMDPSTFRTGLQTIANTHDDFAKTVLLYGTPEMYSESLKRFYWLTSLYEAAAYKCTELEEAEKYKVYLQFTALLSDYVANIYSPELLQDEAATEVLPNLHRFGYYMYRANQELESGNATEYVKEMRKALESCEAMKDIVEYMLEQFKKLMGI